MMGMPLLSWFPIAPRIFASSLTVRIFLVLAAVLATVAACSALYFAFHLRETLNYAIPAVQFLYISAAYRYFLHATGRSPISAWIWAHKGGYWPDKALFVATWLLPMFASVYYFSTAYPRV
jgi:hypothetical protein